MAERADIKETSSWCPCHLSLAWAHLPILSIAGKPAVHGLNHIILCNVRVLNDSTISEHEHLFLCVSSLTNTSPSASLLLPGCPYCSYPSVFSCCCKLRRTEPLQWGQVEGLELLRYTTQLCNVYMYVCIYVYICTYTYTQCLLENLKNTILYDDNYASKTVSLNAKTKST